MYRLSKASLAPRITCLDFQRACASTKSIPCFALLLSLFHGSNSNTTLSILSRAHRLRQPNTRALTTDNGQLTAFGSMCHSGAVLKPKLHLHLVRGCFLNEGRAGHGTGYS